MITDNWSLKIIAFIEKIITLIKVKYYLNQIIYIINVLIQLKTTNKPKSKMHAKKVRVY